MKVEGAVQKPRRLFRVQSMRDASGHPIELDVSALPFGWEEPLVKAFGGQPLPPTRRVGEDSRGQPVFRQVEDDPDYRAKLARWNSTIAVASIYHSLKNEPKVKWDANPDMLATEPIKFYELIAAELKASGIDQGDVTALLSFIQERTEDASVSGIPERREDFLPTAAT